MAGGAAVGGDGHDVASRGEASNADAVGVGGFGYECAADAVDRDTVGNGRGVDCVDCWVRINLYRGICQ